MIKKMLILILVVVFIAGCGSSLSKDSNDASSIADSYRTGSEGLVMEFIENFPPSRFYDIEAEEEDGLKIMLEVKNKGAWNIRNIDVDFYITGVGNSVIKNLKLLKKPGNNKVFTTELEGKSYYNPEGSTDFITFEGTLTSLDNLKIEMFDPTLLVTACYNYKTIASSKICIDPNPLSIGSRENICTPSNIPMSSQGAPIAVTGIDVEARPKKTRLKIHVSNVGGGDVFRQASKDKCNPTHETGLGFNDVDYIRLENIKIGGDNLLSSNKCNPLFTIEGTDYIRLTNGQATITCDYDTSGSSAYTTPIIINLVYSYRNSISKYIQIINSP